MFVLSSISGVTCAYTNKPNAHAMEAIQEFMNTVHCEGSSVIGGAFRV